MITNNQSQLWFLEIVINKVRIPKNILMPKFYTLSKEQTLPCTLDEAWSFFSSPKNLSKITPDYLGFEITSPDLAKNMYPGQIISYKVSPLLGIKLNWMTEITHVEDRKYFVDNQRFGPYKMWHHQHWFEEVPEGVKMKDTITYVLPFGILGRIAHTLFIKKQLEGIFDYRKVVTDRLFGGGE